MAVWYGVAADQCDGAVQNRLNLCFRRSGGRAVAPASGRTRAGGVQRRAVVVFRWVAAPHDTQPCPGRGVDLHCRAWRRKNSASCHAAISGRVYIVALNRLQLRIRECTKWRSNHTRSSLAAVLAAWRLASPSAASAGRSVSSSKRPSCAKSALASRLWANAVRALEKLGVAAAVRALQPPMPSGGIYTWRGMPLITDSSAALAQRIGEISMVLHRADLLAILRQNLPSDTLTLGKHCVRVEQNAAGVTAHFADGSLAQGDLLIGCDGIRSVVRAQLVGDGEPLYAGYTAYRAVTPFDPARVTGRRVLGTRRTFRHRSAERRASVLVCHPQRASRYA